MYSGGSKISTIFQLAVKYFSVCSNQQSYECCTLTQPIAHEHLLEKSEVFGGGSEKLLTYHVPKG